MPESTHAVAQLPGLDVELVHDRLADGSAERVAVRFTGRPDLQSAAASVEPHLWKVLLMANPLLGLQADMLRVLWGPMLEMNPLLKALLPPPRDQV